jgi:putative membrane protein
MAHGIHRSFGRAFVLSALALVGAPGCGDAGSDRQGPAAEQPTEPLSHGQILGVVSTIDQGELKTSETARVRATDIAVRDYAQRIRADHQATETRIQMLQGMLRVAPEESELQADLRRNADRTAVMLEEVPANRFDVTYLDAQISMHQRAIALFDEQLIPNAASLELETFLRDTRASLMQHLAHARLLRERFPTPPGSGA